MASEAFLKLKSILTAFINESDAAKVLDRQLLRTGTTIDNFTYNHIADIVSSITAGASLYCDDKEKISQLNKNLIQLVKIYTKNRNI